MSFVEGELRTSERWAVAAVIVMTLPAALAVPAVGAWQVARAWGGMGWFDKAVFFASLIVIVTVVPLIFRHRLGLFWYGRAEEFSLFEELLLIVLTAAVVGAVSHSPKIINLLAGIVLYRMLIKVLERFKEDAVRDTSRSRRAPVRSVDRADGPLTLKSLLGQAARAYRRRRHGRVPFSPMGTTVRGRNGKSR